MINKEKEQKPDTVHEDSGFVEIATMDVQCHLLIKDKDTNEVLVNKRG